MALFETHLNILERKYLTPVENGVFNKFNSREQSAI
jgi:hypothetical protein